MGGNAIKQLGVEGRRVDMQEFAAIEKHVAKILNLENIGFGVVQAYKKKETFGDMDVVLKTEHLEMVRQLIESHFRPKVISRNHNIFSFDYDNFQIDFICYGGDTFQSALDYFVYSPAGNAVGKIAHQLGLSYGQIIKKGRDRCNRKEQRGRVKNVE
jgi:DNA polymerase/3'-5' exonuclease PolX